MSITFDERRYPERITSRRAPRGGTPETVTKLKKLGFDVLVETDAGAGAAFATTITPAAGATVGR